MSQQLKPFEDVVEFTESGQKHNMIVLAVKAGGLIDGAFFKQLFSGDGKTSIAVVGSSRQAEMVQFRHDIPPSQYSIPGDFYFSLTDDQAEALDSERKRRQHEAAQAAQAKVSAEEEAQLLGGVTIQPSTAVLERAAELWKAAIRESQELDVHDDVTLPAYNSASAGKWQPWIERAKAQLKVAAATFAAATSKPKEATGACSEHPEGCPEGSHSVN